MDLKALPRGMTDAKQPRMGHNTVAREITFDDESGAADISLELDVSPRHFPRFVTGATTAPSAPEIAACSYCGAVGRGEPTCAACGAPGAPVHATLPPLPRVSRYPSAFPTAPAPALSTPPSRGDAVIEAVSTLPFGFWKRLPAYAFLAMVLGNGCMCGGLAGRTNVTLAVLIVLGVAGLVVSSLQRKP